MQLCGTDPVTAVQTPAGLVRFQGPSARISCRFCLQLPDECGLCAQVTPFMWFSATSVSMRLVRGIGFHSSTTVHLGDHQPSGERFGGAKYGNVTIVSSCAILGAVAWRQAKQQFPCSLTCV